MTDDRSVLSIWADLPQELRVLATPIHTEAQYAEALVTFEVVWKVVGGQADHPLGSLFEVLRDRLTAYEERTFPIPPSLPHHLVAFLMERRGMTQTDLAQVLGTTQENVSQLLIGKTALSLETARKLAAHFKVRPAVFLT